MTSELAEFFATLLRIATFVVDVTLTLLCTILLLLASLLPWRLPFIVRELATAHELTLRKFQGQASRQFFLSLVDVVVFAIVMPSFLWPLRWHGMVEVLQRAWTNHRCDDDEDRDAYYNSGYRFETRVEWLGHAFESYADVVLFPLVLIYCISPWRWTLHLDVLRKKYVLRISVVRNWAAWEGFNAVIDMPFVLLGLASVVLPTRIQAFISVLIHRHHFRDHRTADCDARVYLAMLPLLSVVDLLSGTMALVALINPLRCGSFLRSSYAKWNLLEESLRMTPQLQEILRWNAPLRSIALRSGLASLLDLLLLPLGLVVCITVYRAGPLIATLRAAVGSDDVAPAWPMGTSEDLPISRVHQMVLKQSALLLCDLLILPSFILVRLTCYRYPFIKLQREELRNSWGAVAHHVAVFVNSLVLIHDLLLAICALPVLLTLYRLPKVYRLLRLRVVSPLAPLLPEAEAASGTDGAESGIEADLELARNGTQTRIRIWKEIGHLLLDLPLLPLLLILLLTLWRADLVLEQCWRAENDWQRRTSVILEFVFLLRDILGFLALLVVLVTLLRMPKVLLDIYSQRARRVRRNLTPRFTLQHVTLRSGNPGNHQNPGSDGRLVVEVQGVQENDRHLKDLGIIRINVISKSFWDEIGRVFGSSVASLGRALLPFTLKDGKHVKYSDFLPEEAKIDLRLGGRELKSKLLQLDGSIAMCVQLEHRPPQGEEEILAQLPIPAHLLQEAVNRPGEDIQVPEELMTAAPETVCGELLSGAGIRNAMWLCALSELWQLVLDVVHLLLFFFLALAPWRLMQCIYFAGQPSEVWHGTLAKLLSSLLLAKEAMLQLFRRRLEPLLNAAAKDPPQRTSEKLGEVASQLLRQLPMVSARSERALLSELERCQSDVAVSFVQKVKTYSLLQNAVSSYWPGLTLGANLQLTHQCFNPQEHALVIEQISGAQSRADELLFSLAAEVQAASREFKAFYDGAGFLGNACQKPLSEHRRMVQIFAYEVLKDYGTLLLGLLLVLSVYRLPSVLRDLQRHQGDFVHRARMVLNCQVRLLLWDLWMLFTALLASLLALVTLVRALEFLRVAFLHCGSLEELRREALNATKDALDSLGELLLLLTFWDTYKTLVYATIFAILLPAWGLILLPIPLRILIWLAFCILPFVTSQIACLAAYGLTVILFFTMALVRKGSGMPSGAAHLKTLRLTGMNALVLLSILLDAALLSSAFNVNEVEAVLKSTSCWYVASGVTIAWLVVMSMPHAMSQDGCLQSGKFHVGLQLLRRCLLPAALVFIFHLDDREKQRLACLWLAFLSFTAVLGLDLLSQDHLPDSIGLDLVQPPAFLSGLLFLQLLFATLKILVGHLPWLPCVAAALCFLWVLLFQSIGGVGGPLWIFPLQLTASVVVFWFALSKNFLLDGMLEGGLAVLLVLCIVAMITCECLALHRRKSAMEKAGVAKVLQQILEKLSKKGRLLNEAQLPNASNLSTSNLSTLSPIEVAKTLENFEDATRMECLTAGFLQQRKEWLSKLRIGRNDYDVVAECGHRLLEGVCVPPSTVQIFLLLKRKSGRRIPTAIWQMILEYVSDVRYVSKMFAPIVNHFGLGGPGKHLLRAWHIMETLGHRNKAISAAMAITESQSLSHDIAQVGLVVTVGSPSESLEPSWRGRIVFFGRRGVYVENLETSAQTMISFKSGRLQVEKQPLQERIQEDLQRWWLEAENLYGHRCGLKTTEARTRRLHWFSCCWCCRRRRHADAQENTKGGSFSVPRRLCSGCPAVEFPASG